MNYNSSKNNFFFCCELKNVLGQSVAEDKGKKRRDKKIRKKQNITK